MLEPSRTSWPLLQLLQWVVVGLLLAGAVAILFVSIGRVQRGLAAGLQLISSCAVRKKALIYVGPGRGRCGGRNEEAYLAETIASVTKRNGGHAEVHAVGVGTYNRCHAAFMETLATSNRGTFADLGDPIATATPGTQGGGVD